MEKDEISISVKNIIDVTIQNLSEIMVPAGLTQQIAIPIAQNINNLRIASEKAKAEEEKEKEPTEIKSEEVSV